MSDVIATAQQKKPVPAHPAGPAARSFGKIMLTHVFSFSCLAGAVYILATHTRFHALVQSLLGTPERSGLATEILLLVVVLVFIGHLGVLVLHAWNQTRQLALNEVVAATLPAKDSLTGLGNRFQMQFAAEQLAETGSGALVVLDLNNFNPVNDLYGHEAGDELLISSAQRIAAVCHPQDIACRTGSDEFAVISLRSGTKDRSEHLANALKLALEAPFDLSDAKDLKVGVSIGIRMVCIGERTEDILRQADIALARAKANSQLPYVMFQPEMETSFRRSKQMESKLRLAIKAGKITPHFQPLVNLATRELIGFEALARWTDEDLGSVAPAEFIPLAEELGLISELSERVLSYACEQAQQWPSHLSISINISPTQLADPLLGLRILTIVSQAGLSPRRLEIEVTESSIVKNQDLALRLLSDLRTAGVRVAIDDFGTGYSNLYQLKNVKFDNLKIDRSFTLDLNKTSESRVIMEAILKLSRGLGAITTAEGIETEGQLRELVSSGFDNGQGYYFSKALSAADVLTLLKEEQQRVPDRKSGTSGHPVTAGPARHLSQAI